jgi:hypothetical protein
MSSGRRLNTLVLGGYYANSSRKLIICFNFVPIRAQSYHNTKTQQFSPNSKNNSSSSPGSGMPPLSPRSDCGGDDTSFVQSSFMGSPRPGGVNVKRPSRRVSAPPPVTRSPQQQQHAVAAAAAAAGAATASSSAKSPASGSSAYTSPAKKSSRMSFGFVDHHRDDYSSSVTTPTTTTRRSRGTVLYFVMSFNAMQVVAHTLCAHA